MSKDSLKLANFATDKEVSFDPDRDEGIYIGYRQL